MRRHLVEVTSEHDDHVAATRSRGERDELARPAEVREHELGLGLGGGAVPDLGHVVVGAVGVGRAGVREREPIVAEVAPGLARRTGHSSRSRR